MAAGLNNSHKSGRGEEIKPNQTQKEKKKAMKRFWGIKSEKEKEI